MSEETDLSLAILTVLASLGSVPSRVKPTLENAVCELAIVSAATTSAAEIGADGAGIVEAPGISTASFFAGMSEGTVGPVVGAAARTAADLELVDSEMV